MTISSRYLLLVTEIAYRVPSGIYDFTEGPLKLLGGVIGEDIDVSVDIRYVANHISTGFFVSPRRMVLCLGRPRLNLIFRPSARVPTAPLLWLFPHHAT